MTLDATDPGERPPRDAAPRLDHRHLLRGAPVRVESEERHEVAVLHVGPRPGLPERGLTLIELNSERALLRHGLVASSRDRLLLLPGLGARFEVGVQRGIGRGELMATLGSVPGPPGAGAGVWATGPGAAATAPAGGAGSTPATSAAKPAAAARAVAARDPKVAGRGVVVRTLTNPRRRDERPD